MNPKYKLFLFFLFATLMHLMPSPETKAIDVQVNKGLHYFPNEREELCRKACKEYSSYAEWNGQWKERGPYDSLCSCALASCYEVQSKCANPFAFQILANCESFKSPQAKDQCGRGPSPPP